MGALEAGAEWKVRLVAFLLPHLKGDAGERDSAVNAVLSALDTAHAEGLRHAARFCRTVAEGAEQHGEAADALASSIEMIAARVDAEAVEAARQWQDEP
ncbi:hypothetical protein [Methylobacterium sp. ARG-1]|uniref:hypothetical protein n=1 Tax=Methylobacterium sp. ARG-1 TaxID=1692501 RepID=UPI000680F962|nr:hypothetical protein [Methylobacterium sp. ARG-1]KNY20741.1 hypothetical protein AKJ13_20805 [Methylobacterium sp. ARG-1]